MRGFIKLIVLFFCSLGNTQAKNATSAIINNAEKSFQNVSNSANIQNYGGSVFFNPKKTIDGSIYLFEDWNNYAQIVSIDNDVFSLNNINFNIEQQVFQSKVSVDSIFTFKFNNISKLIIGSKTFKPIKRGVYEVISESNNFSLLKAYKLEVIEGSINPMVNRKNDKYKKNETYFIKNKDLITPFKLRKKKVLKLLETNTEAISTFVKAKRLSFSKEEDVKRIIQYHKTL